MSQKSAFPVTEAKTTVKNFFGYKVTDNYFWLKDSRSKRVQNWVDEQNRYTVDFLNSSESKQRLRGRFASVILGGRSGLPVKRGGKVFVIESLPGQGLGSLYVSDLDGANRKIILSLDDALPQYSMLAGWSPSPCGKYLALGIQSIVNGGEAVFICSVSDGRLVDNVPAYITSIAWGIPGMKPGFWYPKWQDASDRCFIYYRTLPTTPKSDYIYGLSGGFNGGDVLFDDIRRDNFSNNSLFKISVSPSGVMMVTEEIHFGTGQMATNLYVRDLHTKRPMVKVLSSVPGHVSSAVGQGNLFVSRPGREFKGEVLSSSIGSINEGRPVWKTIIPENTNSLLMSIYFLSERLIVIKLVDGCFTEIAAHDASGKSVFTTRLPDVGSIASSVLPDEEGKNLNFFLSNFMTPCRFVSLNLTTGTLENLKERSYPDFNKDNYEVKKVVYKSKDETDIPMVLFKRKDIQLTGDNPTLLHAYGGFGIITEMHENSLVLPFVESGGVYAVALIRGGGEKGYLWHSAGSGALGKQKSFEDFIAAAEWLIKTGYTKPSKLAISGGSNGGLVVGAAMVRRPDLFKAVVMNSAVVDMTGSFIYEHANLIKEYGDPSSPEEAKEILRYSPYQNVKFGVKYPSLLIVAGAKDRIVPVEQSYRMTAAMQNVVSTLFEPNRVLLRVWSHGGHNIFNSPTDVMEGFADELTFIFEELGMKYSYPKV